MILDASAVLALLLREAGHEAVALHAQGAMLLSVNLSEVLSRIADKGGDPVAAHALLARLELTIIDFDEALAVKAAALRTPTKAIGASLGDRACLALAQQLSLPVLTADRRWAELDLGIDIRLIR